MLTIRSHLFHQVPQTALLPRVGAARDDGVPKHLGRQYRYPLFLIWR